MAPYSRAYKGVCGNGCSQIARSMSSYNPRCGQTSCPTGNCMGGGIVQRENFNPNDSVGSGLFPAPSTGMDCTPNSADEYTNHMPTRNGGLGMTLGRSGGGGGCNMLDNSVLYYNNFPAVYGWSALGGGNGVSTYMPAVELRLDNSDVLTNRGRDFLTMDEQYAKYGNTGYKPLVASNNCGFLNY